MKEVFTSSTKDGLDDQMREFIENYDVIDWPNITIVTEIVNDDTPSGYHWRATLVPKDTASVLKYLLVEEHGHMKVFWDEKDIQNRVSHLIRNQGWPKDTLLSEEAMMEVKVWMNHTDWEYGLNFYSIDKTICDALGMKLDEEEYY